MRRSIVAITDAGLCPFTARMNGQPNFFEYAAFSA